MTRIVLTHGRGLRHRDEEKLRDRFVWYLRQGLEEAGYDRLDDRDVTFIYYGDLLEQPEGIAPAGLPESGLAEAGGALGGATARFAFEDDAARLADQLANAAGSDPWVCALIEERAARRPVRAEGSGEADRRQAVATSLDARVDQLLDDPRQLQSVLHDRFGSTTPDDDTVKTGVRKLRDRLGDDPRRTAAKRAVETTGNDEPVVLIAYSLGSVIAYDVLREDRELDVCGLLTLGSPLSIDYLRERLARAGESKNALPVPGMLDEWVNVYSEMDPLVLGSGITQFFTGGGEVEGPGPVDRKAENTGYLDAHSPDQYLQSAVTAMAIQQMIGDAIVREGFEHRNDEHR